jgi:hypothetical protein
MIYTVNEAKLALFSPDFECEQLQHKILFKKLLMVLKTADQ